MTEDKITIPSREAFMGAFVARYKTMIKPLLLQGDIELLRLPIQDLVMRLGVYSQEFRTGSGGKAEVHYRFAIGTLEASGRLSHPNERSAKIVLEEVEYQVSELEKCLANNPDYQAQVRNLQKSSVELDTPNLVSNKAGATSA